MSDPSVDLAKVMVHIVRQLLNSIPSTRIIYRQESVMEIAKLPLTICSEQVIPVQAMGYYKISKNPTDETKNLMSLYAHRKDKKDQSFKEFFYEHYKSVNCTKTPIMHMSGLNGNPVYPVTYDYARSVLIFCKPWNGINKDLQKDKELVKQEFMEYIESTNCPMSVKQAYLRAKMRYNNGREIIDMKKEDDEFLQDINNTDDIELKRLIEFSNSFARDASDVYKIGQYKLNIGRNFNWSKDKVESNGKNWLYNIIQSSENPNGTTLLDDGRPIIDNSTITFPTLSNGKEYSSNNLIGRQQTVLCTIFDNLTKWLKYTKGESQSYQPLRMTVLGKGGTGKSFVINTIVTEIRKFFRKNDVVIVTAPTGAAAFNVRGQTIHREFGITKTKKKQTDLSKEC